MLQDITFNPSSNWVGFSKSTLPCMVGNNCAEVRATHVRNVVQIQVPPPSPLSHANYESEGKPDVSPTTDGVDLNLNLTAVCTDWPWRAGTCRQRHCALLCGSNRHITSVFNSFQIQSNTEHCVFVCTHPRIGWTCQKTKESSWTFCCLNPFFNRWKQRWVCPSCAFRETQRTWSEWVSCRMNETPVLCFLSATSHCQRHMAEALCTLCGKAIQYHERLGHSRKKMMIQNMLFEQKAVETDTFSNKHKSSCILCLFGCSSWDELHINTGNSEP